MKTTLKYVAPWLAAAAMGGAIALAPIASAAATPTPHSGPAAITDTDPLVRYGPPGPVRARLPRFGPRRGQHHEWSSGRAVLRADLVPPGADRPIDRRTS